MTLKYQISSVLAAFLLYSCGSEKPRIDEEYSLIGSSSESLELEQKQGFSELVTYLEERDSEYETVKIEERVSLLFSPDGSMQCQLPSKIKKKISETKNWVPKIVKYGIDIKDQALFVEDVSVLTFLNTFNVKPFTGQEYELELTGSPSISLFSILDQGRSSWSYSIDCSGYLNAALEFSARGGSNAIKTAASSSFSTKGSAMIAQGFVLPPIVEAIRQFQNDELRMSNSDALELLFVALKELRNDYNSKDTLEFTKILELMWLSNSGSSNFNGEASLTGEVNMGVSFSGASGGDLTRSSEFKNFETYILNSNVRSLADPITVGELTSRLSSLFGDAQITKSPSKINGDIVFEMLMPKDLSGAGWSIEGVSNAIVTTENLSNGSVRFTIANLPSSKTSFTISRTYKRVALKKLIVL